MTDHTELAYWRARANQARRNAANAGDPSARIAHERLALHYDERAREVAAEKA